MGCCNIRDGRFNNGIIENMLDMSQIKQESRVYIQAIQSKENVTLNQEFAKNFFKINTIHINDHLNGDSNKSDSHPEPLSNETDKIELEEGINDTHKHNKDKIILNYPRLEIFLVNHNACGNEKIVITPNSINGVLKKLGEKFIFGKDCPSMIPNPLLDSFPTLAINNKTKKQNDYNFSDESIGFRQFEIIYQTEKKKYYVVDNKRGTGLFVQVKNKVVIDHDIIISFLSSQMLLQVETDINNNKIIKLRFLQGPHQNEEKVFNPKDKKIVRIGRSKLAEIVFNDNSISRIQCTIVFKNEKWNLYDGYHNHSNKHSTNGLWLLASSKLEIQNDMILKTGNITMAVSLYCPDHD